MTSNFYFQTQVRFYKRLAPFFGSNRYAYCLLFVFSSLDVSAGTLKRRRSLVLSAFCFGKRRRRPSPSASNISISSSITEFRMKKGQLWRKSRRLSWASQHRVSSTLDNSSPAPAGLLALIRRTLALILCCV